MKHTKGKNSEKRPLDLNSSGPMHISIRISNDTEIQQLNKEHLGRDKPTDVLSFELNDTLEDGTHYLGDIIVNKDQAARQSSEYGNDLEHELSALAAHGVLHLLGVHHPDDDENGVHGVTKCLREDIK